MEQRIEALEVGAKFDATQEDVKKVEKEFLTKLQDIRTTMDQEKAAGGTAVSSKELQDLKTENEALKKENARLQYRVGHLVKNMEELYTKSKQ